MEGEVHLPDCFIVTTRFPDADWQPTSEPVTCGFCIKEAGGRRQVGGSKARRKVERLIAQARAQLEAQEQGAGSSRRSAAPS